MPFFRSNVPLGPTLKAAPRASKRQPPFPPPRQLHEVHPLHAPPAEPARRMPTSARPTGLLPDDLRQHWWPLSRQWRSALSEFSACVKRRCQEQPDAERIHQALARLMDPVCRQLDAIDAQLPPLDELAPTPPTTTPTDPAIWLALEALQQSPDLALIERNPFLRLELTPRLTQLLSHRPVTGAPTPGDASCR